MHGYAGTERMLTGNRASVVVRNDVLNDIADRAIQDKAKLVQRLGGDRLAVFDAMDRVGRRAVAIDQLIYYIKYIDHTQCIDNSQYIDYTALYKQNRPDSSAADGTGGGIAARRAVQ